MNQILVVVHQETSNPGRVGAKLREQGYHLDIRCPALGHDLPVTMTHHDAAIIFGGPMSANDDDTLPFIRTELDWIAIALSSGKPYLGICLGAQLLARALGATVAPHHAGQREIGYFDLHPTPAGRSYIPKPMTVYQWHSEGFDLPTGAQQIAQGQTFPNQAFVYQDSAIGLQFHPEITQPMIDEWTTRGSDQLDLPGARPRAHHFHDHQRHGQTVDAWLDDFLETWLTGISWRSRRSA